MVKLLKKGQNYQQQYLKRDNTDYYLICAFCSQGLCRDGRYTPKGTSNMYRHKPLQKSLPKALD
jgi:hypothetical protein